MYQRTLLGCQEQRTCTNCFALSTGEQIALAIVAIPAHSVPKKIISLKPSCSFNLFVGNQAESTWKQT